MKLHVLAWMSFCLAAGCNQAGDEDALLQQPPYELLSDSLEQQPGRADLYFKRAQLLQQNNQVPLAKADYQKAWRLQPSEDHAIGLAGLLIKTNPDSAFAFIHHALKTVPYSIVLRISLVQGHLQKKEYEQALKVADEIITQYPNQIDALLLKAEIEKTLNREKQALSTLEQAYRYAPFDAELVYNLAFEYAQNKNPKALFLADSLIREVEAGKHAEPYYIKGVYYANVGNNQQALNFFDQAISHDYNFLDAYMEKGVLLYEQKKFQQALETFQLAITISPSFADAYLWLAKTQQAMGNKQEAKLNYQRAYGLDKTLTDAKEAAEKL